LTNENVIPHPAIEPHELYEGPEPASFTHAPIPQRPVGSVTLNTQQKQQILTAQIMATIRAGALMVSARLLGAIAVATACAVWAYAVVNPDTARTIAAVGFSVTVLAPVIFLHLQKG
jgi:hypothetical protein